MKQTTRITMLLLAVCAVFSAGYGSQSRDTVRTETTVKDDYVESFYSRIGKLIFDHDVPSRDSQQLLFDEMD
ncbi:MAG: hypothetical protein ABGZ53_27620 [Fuerstiella sp.]